MKRSLLIAPFFPPEHGGIQKYLYNICKNLPQDKIFVMAPKHKNTNGQKIQDEEVKFDQAQPFKIYRTKFSSILRFLHLTPYSIYRQAKKICKKQKIEIVQCGHLYPAGAAGLLLKKFQGISYLVYVYGQEFLEIKNFPRAKFKTVLSVLKNADHIIVIADFLKKRLEKYGIGPNKIIKIPPGVDFEFFRPNLNVENLRKELNLQNKKIIFTCGRLVARKNHKAIISVLPKILKKIKNVVYLIAGDGPEKERLQNLVKKLSLENHVIFLGEVKDHQLPFYYNLCNVFCMPSSEIKETGDVEGFGIVFLEAQACEKPVIGGRTGGIPDAIDDEIDGILIDPENTQALRSALIKILEDEELAKKMGKAGRKKVIQKHDWRKLIERLKPLLE